MAERGSGAFSAEEKAAMKARAAEERAARRASTAAAKKAADRQALLDAIAAMPDDERAIAERIRAVVSEVAPDLDPKTYYGMPAWAKDGKTLCFFQPASKFNVRYSTFGFEQAANLDDGTMWPTSYAITQLTPDAEKRVAALVRQAVSS
jgi:uncharacterized protein YdhG (YjbR/CyaY superfamily)